MSRAIQSGTHIIILGGGTAGWIAANALIAAWGEKGVKVTLIESPDIGTVGVGEGSTPRLKHFFNSIGVEEAEWMPRCNATYKNGITFANWSTRPGFETYYHPFPARTDEHTNGAFYFNTMQRRRGEDVYAHPDRFFLSARLAEERRGPVPDENFPFEIEYGYHFDAKLVAEFLRDKAVSRDVRHVQTRVEGVKQSATGDIESLITKDHGTLAGDFFIDCSGFAGALLQKTLQVPFRSFGENLFNDAAVVLPTPQVDNIASQTVSTALKHGWAWEIPLTQRIGNGYVYSSSHCSADAAETELRETLGLLESDEEARHLQMRVGRVEKHWDKNCLAIGLSQGFIEPLEATALNVVCSTIDDFIATVGEKGLSGKGRASLNDRTNDKFERIRDYIVAHYILNTRDDTDYWRQNRENKHRSDMLKQILGCWMSGGDLSQEFRERDIRSSYLPMSWYCIFAGYGHYPDIQSSSGRAARAGDVAMTEIDEFVRRCAMNFRTQNEQLDSFSKR